MVRDGVRAPAKPTRILFLSQGRATPNTAMGHVRVEHALAAGLVDLPQQTVEVAHMRVPPFDLADRVFVRRAPGSPHWDLHTLRWHLARGWAARRLLQRRLREDAPEVVHITTDQVALLLGAVQRQVACVMSLDTTTVAWLRLLRRLPEHAPLPADLRPLLALERRALEHAALSIPWTATAHAQARRIAPRAAVAEPVHPGIDLKIYAPGTRRRGPGPFRVLFVGGRWAEKGGPDLLAALQPELGGAIELDVVSTQAPPPRPGVNIHAASPGSRGLVELFKRADVVCLPSFVDAVPWVVIEALATGVPVISTRVGSVPELVDGCGMLVDPGDVAGLREALHTLIEQPGLRRALGEAGRARAEERYDARRNTRRLIGLLRSVAA